MKIALRNYDIFMGRERKRTSETECSDFPPVGERHLFQRLEILDESFAETDGIALGYEYYTVEGVGYDEDGEC